MRLNQALDTESGARLLAGPFTVDCDPGFTTEARCRKRTDGHPSTVGEAPRWHDTLQVTFTRHAVQNRARAPCGEERY